MKIIYGFHFVVDFQYTVLTIYVISTWLFVYNTIYQIYGSTMVPVLIVP